MPPPEPASPWIVRKARATARVRLFCFPYSGGGAAAFRGWAEALAGVEVCAIQPPGRESRLREPSLSRMDPLVTEIAREVRALADRPFAFYGHSLGAFVAFEAARALRRAGAPLPRHLFAAGCPAPRMHSVASPVHDRDDAALVAELRRFRGTSEDVLANDELMALVLPAVRADFTLYETYRPADEPPLDVPITAFGGLQDDHASRAQLEGWRAETSRSFLLRMLRGGHFFLHDPDARTLLLGTLLQDLAPLLRA